ncbi:site-specific integrase [Brucella sp. 2716]|uniref:site-specific integrase n=1 Tax=Brucella sp. 2716 TaxID=2975052 RepID=UPI00217DD43F|nr:site-specific integrase [Brucella sp. 2716]UWF60986.1 site-specific integrase [Brucella sp. 2716]
MDGGSYIEPSKTTVREYFTRWLAHEKANVSPKTHQRYEELLLKNVAPVIGSLTLNKLSSARIDGCWQKLLESGRRDGKGGLSPRTVHHCRRVMLTAMDQAIRFHDLRHSHATQLLAAGVHPKIASERLGHSTIGITLDLYSHVMPGMQANAAEQVDAAIKAAKKASEK